MVCPHCNREIDAEFGSSKTNIRCPLCHQTIKKKLSGIKTSYIETEDGLIRTRREKLVISNLFLCYFLIFCFENNLIFYQLAHYTFEAVAYHLPYTFCTIFYYPFTFAYFFLTVIQHHYTVKAKIRVRAVKTDIMYIILFFTTLYAMIGSFYAFSYIIGISVFTFIFIREKK